ACGRGRPRPVEIAGIVAALVAGVVLIGELKELLDRPRPGAEFLGPTGASFPSGHVGNTVLNGLAVLSLWPGGAPDRPRLPLALARRGAGPPAAARLAGAGGGRAGRRVRPRVRPTPLGIGRRR